jgi:4-hydroxy-tetrahydrodipicolinate reductase
VISIVLVGADGRMGRAIERAAAEGGTGASGDLAIVARVTEHTAERAAEPAHASGAKRLPMVYEGGSREGGSGAWGEIARSGDVVVEFSTPEGFRATAAICMERRLPLVSGTTGLGPDDERLIDELASRAPVLRAPNFSLGVLALRRALESALADLPEDWDVEIVERHHRGKVDSPSGTALALARDAARLRGWGEDAFRHGRQGRLGVRPERQIGLHALRGGSWVGDHTVLLAGHGETLELRHSAEDRLAFAHGALAAARFVATARPGRYGLEDVLPPARRQG